MEWLTPPAGWALEGTAVCAARIHGEPPPLHPAERSAVDGAAEVRRREFAFGRAALREALVAAGCTTTGPLVRRPDRSPDLPATHAASLSHSREIAAAAASSRERWRALGIDVEAIRPLDPGIDAIVRTPVDRGDTLALFSAKEAMFKAWYAAGGGRLTEFHEFSLHLHPGGAVEVLVQPEPQRRLTGRIALAHGHWWSIAGIEER
ncbi:MAG: 4'-phosphopantetheinyl transferase superfamily protein [Myxococcota bacterium]